MTKELKTLPADIDKLFFEGNGATEAYLDQFLANLKQLITERLTKRNNDPTIRMSKLGLPDRKLWYEHHTTASQEEPSKNALKFIYGDIIEQLIIYLAKECGHKVEDEQKEWNIDGIIGHQDAKIDGTVVDVKSASSYAFRKFSERTIFKDDPFGYIAQLSAYTYANGADTASFIGVNKENGELCILPLHEIDQINPKKRIEQVKKLAAPDAPKPEKKCYEPIPHNKSGNMQLHKNCTYCPFQKDCWKDANNGKGIRYFNYSNGTVALVTVVEEPKVEEISNTEGVQ